MTWVAVAIQPNGNGNSWEIQCCPFILGLNVINKSNPEQASNNDYRCNHSSSYNRMNKMRSKAHCAPLFFSRLYVCANTTLAHPFGVCPLTYTQSNKYQQHILGPLFFFLKEYLCVCVIFNKFKFCKYIWWNKGFRWQVLIPEMKLRQLRSRSQVVGMTIRVVRIANNICAFIVHVPMVRCALGNNFDKLSLSNIRYSMQQACRETLGPMNILPIFCTK